MALKYNPDVYCGKFSLGGAQRRSPKGRILNMKQQTKIEKVLNWLREHDLIAINRLEKKLNIPQRVLSKVVTGLDGRSLPEKYHNDLIAELKKYGFK